MQKKLILNDNSREIKKKKRFLAFMVKMKSISQKEKDK